MKFWTIVLLSISIVFFSCNEEKTILIKPFNAQNELSKSNEGTKSIYFLIQGYTGIESDYQAIERHVCTINRDSLDKIYKQYWLNYYRESEKTNNKNIQESHSQGLKTALKWKLSYMIKKIKYIEALGNLLTT